MSVLFDTSVLLLLLCPNAKLPNDPDTQQPLEHPKQRIEYLIKKLNKSRAKILVPTPVLSELLVHAGAASNEYVQQLQQSPFMIEPFDTRAAIECADAMKRKGIRGKGKDNPRAKVKFDRQIVAIAKVCRVDAIYSDDSDIFKYAGETGIKVIRSYELGLDPDSRQQELNLEPAEGSD